VLQQLKNLRHIPTGIAIVHVAVFAGVLPEITPPVFAFFFVVVPLAGITLIEEVRVHYGRKKPDIVSETEISVLWQIISFSGLTIVVVNCISAYLAHQMVFTSGIVCVAVIGTVLWQSRRWLGESYAAKPRIFSKHKLVTKGPYQLVRHPIYTCLIALLPASGLVFGAFQSSATTVGTLIGTALFGGPLIKRALLEEELLGALPQTPETPRFIPTPRSLWRYLREPFLP